jgi:hypothetical protein
MFYRWIAPTLFAMMFAISITGATGLSAQEKTPDLKDVIGVLPKFAIPMREVGDRFQNMYYAAKGGNWALAYYMSKVHERSDESR